MKKLSLWDADLHIHTNKSNCAPPESVPEAYLPYAAGEKLKILGFSNHLYYDRWVEGEPGTHTGAAKVLSLRPDLDRVQKTTETRLLLGCEVDILRGMQDAASLHRVDSSKFDYILISTHIMNYSPYYPPYADIPSADYLRDMMLERFFYACSLDYDAPVGICHPLYPMNCPWEQEVVDGISDSRLADCFTTAKKRNISIEIHACLFRPGTAHNADGLSPSYLRYLSAAKACGCKFHFGGDAHTPGAFVGIHDKLRLAARTVGIGPEDMWELPALESK